MDTIFMNFKNSNTSEPHVLMPNFTYKLDLRRYEKVWLYQVLLFTIHGKTYKAYTIKVSLKYQNKFKSLNDTFNSPDG